MSSWDWNVVVFEAFNGLAGRMPVLDKLIGLPLRNDFIKAGLIGACFLAAWYARVPSRRRRAIRGTLLMTMIGTVFALAASQVICHFSHIPRPYVLSQDVQKFDGRQLVPQQSWPFRVPLENPSQERWQKLQQGDIPRNDIGSFPSDHATLFVALSFGIFLARRRIGAIALAWTFCAILAPRIIMGMHSPADILAGAALAVASVSFWNFVGQRVVGPVVDLLAHATVRYSAISSGLLFLFVYEACCTFSHLKELVTAVAKFLH
jgi:membrane-associated phospholipid phosphatase